MVDLNFFFFEFGPAMQLIFKLGYIPQIEDFKELTSELYEAMFKKLPEEESSPLKNKKVFALIPHDEKLREKLLEEYGNNFVIVGEDEISIFERTANAIENYCRKSGRGFESMKEKLIYMAEILPDVFSKDTPYAKYAKY